MTTTMNKAAIVGLLEDDDRYRNVVADYLLANTTGATYEALQNVTTRVEAVLLEYTDHIPMAPAAEISQILDIATDEAKQKWESTLD